jgi:16S rRNA (cytidine1402-2'-O)-methyltransferase
MAALSIGGLPTDRFLFYGFLPAKSAARQKILEGLRKRPETLIFYESPRRLPAFLKEALNILGDRQVAVAREITKIFEETLRGTLAAVLEKIGKEEVKGEITVILAGNTEQEAADPRAIREALQKSLENSAASWKDAVERVAEELGVAKREVYREALKMKEDREWSE